MVFREQFDDLLSLHLKRRVESFRKYIRLNIFTSKFICACASCTVLSTISKTNMISNVFLKSKHENEFP